MDIFASNQSSLATKCITIPGISNHEAVLVEPNISAKIKPLRTRKTFLLQKANFDNNSLNPFVKLHF